MRISDWSSDVCSSDLRLPFLCTRSCCASRNSRTAIIRSSGWKTGWRGWIRHEGDHLAQSQMWDVAQDIGHPGGDPRRKGRGDRRSEEHTSELQSLMRTSYAVFCLNKNND